MNTITALIPAHNEEQSISSALASVMDQGIDRIIVIDDRSTDMTAQIARSHGVEVRGTVDNEHKKAGALNQVLADLLPSLIDPRDYVLVMDADSELDEGFVQAARTRLDNDPELGGVSGTFQGGPGGGFVGMLQRNEYARYARDVRRLKGRALVLTGTATMFRVSALKSVQFAREAGWLPAADGVYDTKVLTEDNELTLALMHTGWKILAPKECTLVTEIMPTWTDLAKQRLRWKRGALENIKDYGFNRITAPYWGRQALSLISVLATIVYLAAIIFAVSQGTFSWHPFWVAVTTVFILERVVSVRSRGQIQQIIAAVLVVEMVFDVWLQFVQARAFTQVALRRKANW